MLSPTPARAVPILSKAGAFFLVLFALDSVLVLLHVAVMSGDLSDARLLITRERALAEWVQYLKAAGAASMLAAIFRGTGSLTALVWSAGLAAVAADDALAVHERFGAVAGPVLFPAGLAGLSPAHAGELVFLASGAALFAAAVVWASVREGNHGWAITRALGGALALLAVFRIGVDALHAWVTSHGAGEMLAIVEDGGEMVAMSALLAIAFALWDQARASRSTWAASSGDVGFR